MKTTRYYTLSLLDIAVMAHEMRLRFALGLSGSGLDEGDEFF